jgi:hypothetical protein
MAVIKRILLCDVDIIDSAAPLTRGERAAVNRLVTQGVPSDQAERVVRRLRESPRRCLPAGEVVEVLEPARGPTTPDDRNWVLVRSADGLVGRTRRGNLAASVEPGQEPQSRRQPERPTRERDRKRAE